MTINEHIDQLFFTRLLARHNLLPMWEFISRTNEASALPYHNTQHMAGVAMIANRLLHTERPFVNAQPGRRRQVEVRLLIACIWHDYNHSGGAKSDEENINIAIKAMKDYCAGHVTWLSPYEVNHIGEILRVTQYDGAPGFRYMPSTYMEKIIRDADLLYTFSDRTSDIVRGLYTELKLGKKLPKDFTYDDFLKGQKTFFDACTFYTHMGQVIHEQLSADVLRVQNLNRPE